MEQAEERVIRCKKIKFLGRAALLPKIVPLPIPFVARSEQTGEVICDPVGEFDPENADRLLDGKDKNGLWELIETVYEDNGGSSTPQTGEGDEIANFRRGPGRPKKEA